MHYLELEQLIVGNVYHCTLYSDRTTKHRMTYLGDGEFQHGDATLSVYGDIRFVIPVV